MRGFWSAQRASLGARSLKAGHTRFFVGYKKHTLRLWLRAYEPAVLLIPLISWATPAHVPEGYLLKASVQQCQRRFGFCPDIVVGDLGYIHQETKKEIRQKWKVAVVTKLKAGMNLIEPFDASDRPASKGRPFNGRPTMKSTKLIVLSRRAMRRFAALVGRPVPVRENFGIAPT